MYKVTAFNYWNIEEYIPDGLDYSVDDSGNKLEFGMYGTKCWRSESDITDSVLSVNITNIDFVYKKEASKATIELSKDVDKYNTSNATNSVDYDAYILQENLVFNNHEVRLGTVIKITSDEAQINGGYDITLFYGRITDMDNDATRVRITCSNTLYELRNIYNDFYKRLATYVNYKPTEGKLLNCTLYDIKQVIQPIMTGMNSGGGSTWHENTRDKRYAFNITPNMIIGKTLSEILNLAINKFWEQYILVNKLSINRIKGNVLSVHVSDGADGSNTPYMYPVLIMDYNSLNTDMQNFNFFVTTFYDWNTSFNNEYKSEYANIGGFIAFELTEDNVISYKMQRSIKDVVNEFEITGYITDDKKNKVIKSQYTYPPDMTSRDSQIMVDSLIKYGKSKRIKQIDLENDVVSLETYAKDIGSILCEPDYNLTLTIRNNTKIQLYDCVYVNISGITPTLCEVRNIEYRLSDGSSETTLELHPVMQAIVNTSGKVTDVKPLSAKKTKR